MRDKSAIASLAARQHGVITTAQAEDLGFDRFAVGRWVKDGWLHPKHRGVYAVGTGTLTPAGVLIAAVYACGPGAVLSHQSAAGLLGLRPLRTGRIHVTVPTTNGRKKRKNIVVHKRPDVETTTHEGIPTTTPAQTLKDIKTDLTPKAFARALEQAEILRYDVGELRNDPRPPTASELEDRFLALIAAVPDLPPPPLINKHVNGHRVDFAWPEQRLIVETDGWETHGTRTAFERDRQRDADHARAGYVVLRFTYDQVTTDPATVTAAVRRAWR